MRIQLIQQKVPIGSQVTFTLKTGDKISGSLAELGIDYIALDTSSNAREILEPDEIARIHIENQIEGPLPADSNSAPVSEVKPSVPHPISVEVSNPSVPEELAAPDTEDPNPVQVEESSSSEPSVESIDSVPEELAAPDTEDPNPVQVEESSSSEPSVESIDSVPEELAAPDTEDPNPVQSEEASSSEPSVESADSVNFEELASEKLTELEKQFEAGIQNFKLELEPPDLTFSEIAKDLKNWQNTNVYNKWDALRNTYEYALKMGELSAKFGRIKPIVSDLESLVERFPESTTMKRVLAYFHSISDNWDEALRTYQEIALQSEEANRWFDVAVSALKVNRGELACYSLGKFFYEVSIIDKLETWYVYVDLLQIFNNLPAFRELCKKDKDDIQEGEIEILLDTAIYLLKKTDAEAVATEIMQNRVKGEPIKSLLEEACQKLSGKPVESYRRFLSKFMSDMIVSHTKTSEGPEPINTKKQFDYHPAPQKQKWQMKSVPSKETLYREAKQADTSGHLELAARLYQKCINQNIRYDSAIKDMAMVLVRLERSEEAVDLLEKSRQKVGDKQSLDNVLINVYPAAGQYEKAIDLLKNSFEQTSEKEKRSLIRLQIASNYIKLEDYVSAESEFWQVLKLQKNNVPVQRNLALCLSKQKRYDEAKQILNKIQNASFDAKTTKLLEAIERAQMTGKFNLDDDSIIEIETVLSYFSGELSDFAQFFLDRCTFDGVPPERVNEGKYIGSEKDSGDDIEELDKLAKQLGTRRPRDRSSYHLSSARIYFDRGDNRNFFYRYLCRSFASRGDDAAGENKHLDTVRNWYCEALKVYDGDRGRRKDEQDAVNSLVRYLYSTLGHAHIDLTPKIPSIDKALDNVINDHPDKGNVFNAIAYLVSRSRYAANKILNRLYYNKALQTMAVEYLRGMEIEVPDVMEGLSDFVRPWNELRERFDEAGRTSDKLQLLNNFDLTTSWLEDNIKFVEDIRSRLFFELDQQRVGGLQKILETALELCKQVTFEERERLCFQLRGFCQDLSREIEESPTKLSVEDVYPIIEVIQEKVNAYLEEELYETSKPDVKLELALESYVPDTDHKIEVQLGIQNEKGRSPAESLTLVVDKDQTSFVVTEPEIKRDESLRGGEQSILKVPLRVTDEALVSQTFSLPVYAQYRTRAGSQEETSVENFSIRLYSEDEFETIKNPYARYAEGGIVDDPKMFFGRKELIKNIAQAIQASRLQSKCVLVFGQKRSGKSSVLYHLKEVLEEDRRLLVLDLKNIGTLRDPSAKKPLLYQFLNRILTRLARAIERKQEEGFSSLRLSIPGKEFYEHPAPLQCFEDTFEELKDLVSKQEDWRGVRVVLLIDEFQYIYEQIVAGEIHKSFMQNWKALLQANYFSAVLVGQDVMPKFKAAFPNEFGTTQDERITYLAEPYAKQLIEDPIRIGGEKGKSRYREQAIERILELTEGSPFYIQMLCNRLVEYMNVKHAELVTEADVEQVKNDLISGVNALDLSEFDNLYNAGDTSADAISDEDALKILKVIADNSRTSRCRRDSIVCETYFPVDTILEDLVEREVVERDDQYYQIRVGLFKEWLIANK